MLRFPPQGRQGMPAVTSTAQLQMFTLHGASARTECRISSGRRGDPPIKKWITRHHVGLSVKALQSPANPIWSLVFHFSILCMTIICWVQ
ncbi:hypothetical protein BDW69DRAFT_160414 [Aspergillus filifer]